VAGHATTGDPDRVAEVIARLAISLVLTCDRAICLDDSHSMRALGTLVLLTVLRPPAA
jgi:hypothetical protein